MSRARLHLRLKPAAEAKVRSGHPWIFADSIRDQNRVGSTGELGVIFDKNDRFLAVGLYDATSPIRLRVLHAGKPTTIGTGWWRDRLRESISRRDGIFTEETTAGRLVNGESDSFPALVLDRYDQTYVFKLYSGIWFPRLSEMLEIFTTELKPAALILRLSRNIATEAKQHGLEDGHILAGEGVNGPVQFLENGLHFEADVLKGQKTGFFLDQRENRQEVGLLAKGKDVLNAFSFSGGFSLYAARGGARSVTDVDISAHALESSKQNFALNNLESVRECEHKLVQADVFEWLQKKRQAEFDLIVLDPPSLAKRQSEKAGALKAYGNMALAGSVLARKRGIFVCCSCSAHVRASEFFETITTAMKRARRNSKILRTTQEPLDHQAGFPEAEYLKAIYVQLD